MATSCDSGTETMRDALNTLHIKVWAWLQQDEAQGLTEYALILALIAVVAVAALTLLGGKVTSELSTVSSSVGRAIP